MLRRLAFMSAASMLGTLVFCVIPTSSASASPISGGALTSGKAVKGVVSTQDGIDYTFTAVAGKHFTLAITSPKVSPSGGALAMTLYTHDGTNQGTADFSTGPAKLGFTPGKGQAGTATVIIRPVYDGNSTGSFTLTYKAR